MKKVITFVVTYGCIFIIAFSYRDILWDWLNQSDFSDLPYMFSLAVLFGVIPIIPFSIFAGLMGVKYGVIMGTAINWTGSVGASALFFLLARYYFVEYFQRYVARFTKIQRFEEIINRNAFLAVLFVRMIPIVPPPVVNIYSGLSSMGFKAYILATAIGKIPGMIMYAYLGNQLFTSIHSLVVGISIYLCFLIIVMILYRSWHKAKNAY